MRIRNLSNTSPLKSLATLLAVLIAAIGLSGCANTAEGIGEDVEEAGDEIEEEFDD